MPVFDHLAMSKGRVMVFMDGQGEALSAPLTLPDGSVINPDGSYWPPLVPTGAAPGWRRAGS
jgi:hypothetical protein